MVNSPVREHVRDNVSCRRPLPARMQDWGKRRDKWQNMHRHRRGRPRSGLANKDGAASHERYPRVFKGGRQMIRTGPIIVTASTDCRHTGAGKL